VGASLFHDHPIGPASTEDLGRVHLLGLGRRDDELAGGGGAGDVGVGMDSVPEQGGEGLGPLVAQGAGDVGVGMDSVPEQGGEGLGPLVAQVLVLVPGLAPPPVAGCRGLRILWDAAGDGQGRVEGLEPRRQGVHQGHVIAP